MFERFVQHARRPRMGLAIIRSIVEAHGRWIYAKANNDHSLTVRVELPADA